MRAVARLGVAAVIAAAAGWTGFAAGERGMTLAELRGGAEGQISWLLGRDTLATVETQAADRVIYWRHPDGLPDWSANQAIAADGRPFLPVRASEDVSFDPAPAPVPVAAGERRILYYRNPMGLPDTSPVPKQDSMGMDYIPVYEGADSADGSVTVSPGKLQRTGVRTAEAVLAPLADMLRAPGIVALDDRRISVIALRADAFIETVADVTVGSTISAGTPLATVYSPEIAQAVAQFVADLRTDGGQREGSRQRLENLGVPGDAINRIASARKVSVSMPVTSPRGGVVLERRAVEGMMSKAGETLFRIADMSRLWVIADVPEGALLDVGLGSEVRVSFAGIRGSAAAGRISAIYPELDPVTRTAKLRIDIPNPDGQLRASMYADVEITLGGTPVVQVPEGSVIDTGDRQVVISDLGEGRFRAQPVTVGRRGKGMVEIVDGVAAGDRVVSAATFLIDAESNLNAALAALAAPDAQE